MDCLTLGRLAELLAGEALAAQGRRPVSAAVLAGTVRQVLQTPAAGVFGDVREHVSTERALVEAHRTLRDLGAGDLVALEKASSRARDVVAISRAVRRRLAAGGFHDERDLLDTATDVVRAGASSQADPRRGPRCTTLRFARGTRLLPGRRHWGLGAGVRPEPSRRREPPKRSSRSTRRTGTARQGLAGPGPVLLYLPQRLGSSALGLLGALAAAEGLVVIAGVCGAPDADAQVGAVVRRLAGAEAWQPPGVSAPAPSRIVAVPDADEEVRTALRGVVDGMRRGIPLQPDGSAVRPQRSVRPPAARPVAGCGDAVQRPVGATAR